MWAYVLNYVFTGRFNCKGRKFGRMIYGSLYGNSLNDIVKGLLINWGGVIQLPTSTARLQVGVASFQKN